VKESVTEVFAIADTLRSETVPGEAVSGAGAKRVAVFSTSTMDLSYELHAAMPMAIAVAASVKVRLDTRPPCNVSGGPTGLARENAL
jgi:hypothetical protein